MLSVKIKGNSHPSDCKVDRAKTPAPSPISGANSLNTRKKKQIDLSNKKMIEKLANDAESLSARLAKPKLNPVRTKTSRNQKIQENELKLAPKKTKTARIKTNLAPKAKVSKPSKADLKLERFYEALIIKNNDNPSLMCRLCAKSYKTSSGIKTHLHKCVKSIIM